MKDIVFRLPPTNRWLKFMLGLQSDRMKEYLRDDNTELLSHWHKLAKDGFLVWNHAKVWYLGIGTWRIGGYAQDGSDADAVMAKVLGKMLEVKTDGDV